MGHTSEAVTQASDQVKNLALVTTQAVEQFHSRPFHYLTTTRATPAPRSPNPKIDMDEIYQRKELAYRCLIDAARSLSGAADIDELVGQILSSSRDVMQCWACSVSLPHPETGDLIIRAPKPSSKGKSFEYRQGRESRARLQNAYPRKHGQRSSRLWTLCRHWVGDKNANPSHANHPAG